MQVERELHLVFDRRGLPYVRIELRKEADGISGWLYLYVDDDRRDSRYILSSALLDASRGKSLRPDRFPMLRRRHVDADAGIDITYEGIHGSER